MIIKIRQRKNEIGLFGECTSKELVPYIGKKIFIPDDMIKIMPDEKKSQ